MSRMRDKGIIEGREAETMSAYDRINKLWTIYIVVFFCALGFSLLLALSVTLLDLPGTLGLLIVLAGTVIFVSVAP